ncbi:MAG: hypothetical protein ACRDSH_20960 [Pseudonocardiaceae bacterium]
MAEQVNPALADFDDEEDNADEEGHRPATRRWVRYVMPVMVEVDCDSDEIARVVTIPEEIREDRDGMGHFCVYDEKFVRRHSDWQPEVHALCVTEPRGSPASGQGLHATGRRSRGWEEAFDLTEADDAYADPK